MPLDSIFSILYVYCIQVKVGQRAVRSKAVYLVIGITMSFNREVLCLLLAQTKGAKFWLQMVIELRKKVATDLRHIYRAATA